MTIIDQLVYKITGDNSQFDKTLDNSDKQMNKFGGVAKTIFAGVTVAAIGMAIKKVAQISMVLIASASDAEETRNKFNVTFSGIRDSADATAKNLAANYGLSSQKSQELLSNTGDLLTGFGFTQESALDLSTQVNTLAVDLASFTNFSGGAEGASAALTKALLGERESIKSLGIAITEADIKQLAEDKGITGTLDRQTKAMLTLELAVKQSKNAIGDFARSSDGYANQVRILDSSMEDLKTTLGNKLLPVATSIIGVMNDVVKAMNSDNTAATKLMGSTNDLVKISGDYKDILETLKTKSGELTDAENARLISIKNIVGLQLQSKLAEVAEGYRNTTYEINNQTSHVAELQAQEKAYEIVLLSRNDASTRLNELSKIQNKTWEEQVESQTLAMAIMQTDMMVSNDYQKVITKLTTETTSLNKIEGERALAIDTISKAVAEGTLDIEIYKNANTDLYNVIKGNAEDINKAIEKKIQQGLRSTQIVVTESEVTERELENTNEAYKTFYSDLVKLRGSDKDKAFALIQEQADAYIASGISLVEVGKWQSTMIDEYRKQETATAKEEYAKQIVAGQARSNTIVAMFGSEKDKVFADIQAQADAYLASGVSITDVAKWQSEQIDEYRKKETDATEAETKKQVDFYKAMANGITDSVSSIWSSILQMSADATDQQLSDLDATYQNDLDSLAKKKEYNDQIEAYEEDRDDAIKELGSSATALQIENINAEYDANVKAFEDKLADRVAYEAEVKTIEDERDKQKTDLAIKQAEREKELAIFEVGINTARAIMQIWSDKTSGGVWGKAIWTGIAAGAGIAQIAAINSAPLPSYEVGTINVPTDRVAQLHKGETVLTKGITEEAKTQGITIAPSGSSGSGTPAILMLYLDGRKVAESAVTYINTGSVGKIDMRVVK